MITMNDMKIARNNRVNFIKESLLISGFILSLTLLSIARSLPYCYRSLYSLSYRSIVRSLLFSLLAFIYSLTFLAFLSLSLIAYRSSLASFTVRRSLLLFLFASLIIRSLLSL